jgi:hypothetical protein
MFIKIYKNRYVKHVILLLIVSILNMSFTMRKYADVVLPAGTPLLLETTKQLVSDQMLMGDLVEFKLRSDVKVGDKVVIAAGALAKGQVIRVQKARGVGKEGFFEIQLKTITAVDGQEVLMSNNNFYQEGENKQSLSIVLGVLICILFLTMKGKNAVAPAGYSVNASVATNTTIKI